MEWEWQSEHHARPLRLCAGAGAESDERESRR